MIWGWNRMSVYKDKKTNNWVVTLRYTDLDGSIKRKAKRGFATKKLAREWKDEFMANISVQQGKELTMTVAEFYQIYLNDISNVILPNTMRVKKIIYDRYIYPNFKNKVISEVRTADIIRWQNDILGQNLKDTYVRTINNQLFALFNHAEKYYDLQNNPIKKTKSIGSKDRDVITFWTKEEFDKFISVVDDEVDYIHFNVLFYTGIRIGELIAVRLKNIDFDLGHIEITESAQYEKGKYIFTKPKTKKSERIVTIPAFLTQLIKKHVERFYFIDSEEQVFRTDKNYLGRALKKYADKAQVKHIRVHDLRHSHASLLIEQGIQPNIVQQRLGHEKIETTLKTYSHLYPNKQYHLAEFLNEIAVNTSNNKNANNNNPLMIGTIK